MDSIIFKSDTVLSDVHLYTPNCRHLMVRLNAIGQPVFLSKFKFILDANGCHKDGVEHLKEETHEHAEIEDTVTCQAGSTTEAVHEREGEGDGKDTIQTERLLDKDGDLDVARRPPPAHALSSRGQDSRRDKVHPTILSKGEQDDYEEDEESSSSYDEIKIEHTMATSLEDAGKQVWRGAFLLADYILHNSYVFQNGTVLELGAGTGVTSIVMATVAKSVFCTDVGDDLLNLCEHNINANKHIYGPTGSQIKVRELDWLRDELCTDINSPYSWSEDEISELYDHTDFLMAADVFYDDDLTDAFFRTLYRIVSNLRNPCIIYFSVEKRLNFTLRRMDVTCEAYDHFRLCLADLETICDGKTKFTVEPVRLTFPQFLLYERVEQLELWKVTADPAFSTEQN